MRLRVACLQWKFQPFESAELFWQELSWQVMTACEDYQAQLIILPEYVAAGFPAAWPAQEEWVSRLSELSQRGNVWIVGGSLPHRTTAGLFNRSWITGPDGSRHFQDKIHITPWEKDTWNMVGGSEFRVIDIGLCRIAVAICYDAEFPELIRAFADSGAEVLCVPYCTDDAQGHHRVTVCARARAIENTLYVAAAGCVGTLTSRAGFAHHHASSLIATPCDLGFPPGGLAAQALPGQAQCLVADLDLTLLRHMRENGTVLPLQNRRKDLFP